MAQTILITGGAGFIGSHTAVELVQAGYRVVVVDNLSNADRSGLEGVRRITGLSAEELPFCQVDCCDKQALQDVFNTYPIDAAIHFAAFKAVGESVAQPLRYYRNNLVSFMNLLEIMQERGGGCVVFSSSATVYGQPEHLPVTEESPRLPANCPYGNTKQICEDILRDTLTAAQSGPLAGAFKGIALRYFNPIGAHASALIGELPRGVPNNLVPFITQTAAGVRKELSVYGSDYNTPDGTPLRDYIDVVDLAKAHVVAVRRMLENKGKAPYEIFNIGTGKPLSVLELVTRFEAVNHVPVPHKVVARRPGDVEAVWADTSLANQELGWKAECPTDETLAKAWAWEKHVRGIS